MLQETMSNIFIKYYLKFNVDRTKIIGHIFKITIHLNLVFFFKNMLLEFHITTNPLIIAPAEDLVGAHMAPSTVFLTYIRGGLKKTWQNYDWLNLPYPLPPPRTLRHSLYDFHISYQPPPQFRLRHFLYDFHILDLPPPFKQDKPFLIWFFFNIVHIPPCMP